MELYPPSHILGTLGLIPRHGSGFQRIRDPWLRRGIGQVVSLSLAESQEFVLPVQIHGARLVALRGAAPFGGGRPRRDWAPQRRCSSSNGRRRPRRPLAGHRRHLRPHVPHADCSHGDWALPGRLVDLPEVYILGFSLLPQPLNTATGEPPLLGSRVEEPPVLGIGASWLGFGVALFAAAPAGEADQPLLGVVPFRRRRLPAGARDLAGLRGLAGSAASVELEVGGVGGGTVAAIVRDRSSVFLRRLHAAASRVL